MSSSLQPSATCSPPRPGASGLPGAAVSLSSQGFSDGVSVPSFPQLREAQRTLDSEGQLAGGRRETASCPWTRPQAPTAPEHVTSGSLEPPSPGRGQSLVSPRAAAARPPAPVWGSDSLPAPAGLPHGRLCLPACGRPLTPAAPTALWLDRCCPGAGRRVMGSSGKADLGLAVCVHWALSHSLTSRNWFRDVRCHL